MRIVFTLAFLSFNCLSFAQSLQTIYFDKNWVEVKQPSLAEFSRTITELPDGMYELKDFYKNNILKQEGKSSGFESIKFQGIVKSYDKDGHLEDEVNYEEGMRKGEARSYYPNGKLKKLEEYFLDDSIDTIKSPPFPKTKMISFFDSTGVQLVKDGSGYYSVTTKTWIEKGKYLNGFKDSIWTGQDVADNKSYREVYSNGKLETGVSVKEGKSYSYNEVEMLPEYPGGISNFYRFVGKNYRFPTAALRNGVSGRLILSFVVEKDGTLTDLRVNKDLGFGTGKEALKLLEKSPDWIPGKQRGIPVRVQYTLPIVLAVK